MREQLNDESDQAMRALPSDERDSKKEQAPGRQERDQVSAVREKQSDRQKGRKKQIDRSSK